MTPTRTRGALSRTVSLAALPAILWFFVFAPGPAGLASAPLPAAQAASGSCNLTAAGRVVAVGDVHGAFDRYVDLLREAQLIDKNRRWIGGNAILVQLGDVLDRGGDSRRALDLIRQLEGEAAKAGGQVKFLLGNHEFMRMGGDFRYVHAGEYEAFKSADASDLRQRLLEHLSAQNAAAARARNEKFDAAGFRRAFLEATPLGSVEMQIAFSETGEYGKWLREHDVMARVNGVIFLHGGVHTSAAALGCDAINARVRAEAKSVKVTDPNAPRTLLWGPDGPLWYRGISGVEPVASDEELASSLKALGATRIVVGHTASPNGKVRSLYDGRVLAIDTGMLGGEYFPDGAPSALEFAGGKITAIYMGSREEVKGTPPAALR